MKASLFIIVLALVFNAIQGQEICFFKTSDGESLSYSKIGTGPVIVFLSGGPGYGVSPLKPWADTLSESYKCILFEQRGIGLSGNVKFDSTTINLHRAVLDIEDLRKHLGEEQISLCGISWGGGLAQAYASYYPNNVKKMVLVSSIGPDMTFFQPFSDNIIMRRYPNERDSLERLNNLPSNKDTDYKKLIYFQLPYFYDHDLGFNIVLKEFSNAIFSPKVSELMWEDLFRNFDLKSKLLHYKGQCIIIKGRQDVIPDEASYQIKELLPQTEILIIERSGHYPNFENPKEFYSDLKSAFSEKK